jgi:DNA-binding beta-propeller fold protein YncE
VGIRGAGLDLMQRRINVFAISIALCVLAINCAAQDKAPLRLVQTIPMPDVKGRLDHMDVDVKNQRLFVAGLENGSLEVVDIRSSKWLRSIPGFKKPQGVWYVPELKKLFVASGDDGMLRVFRADTLKLIQEIHLEAGANRIAYDPGTKHIYVGYGGKDAGKDYGQVAIIDARSDRHIGDVQVVSHPAELLLDKSGQKLFVFIPTPSRIQVIDTATRRVISTWEVANQRPGDAAFDASTNRLMIGTRTPPEMIVLDAENGKQVANLPTVEGMDGVYFDKSQRRVYVSGGRGFDVGFVHVYQQLDADRYEFMGKVPTRPGAGTSLWVPELNRYFVAAPATGSEQAAILVYEPQR